METLIMTARVSLLILVTGTFTALWSGDHPERIAAADRPTPVLIGRRAGFSEQSLQWTRMARRAAVERTGGNASATVSALPLPDGIAAGMYLVTDQWGRTQVRLVAQNDVTSAESRAAVTREDHYMVEQDGFRWHYIRLDDSIANRVIPSSNTRHN